MGISTFFSDGIGSLLALQEICMPLGLCKDTVNSLKLPQPVAARILTNRGRNEMADILQTCIFLNKNGWSLLLCPEWWHMDIGQGNGLAPKRRQAISCKMTQFWTPAGRPMRTNLASRQLPFLSEWIEGCEKEGCIRIVDMDGLSKSPLKCRGMGKWLHPKKEIGLWIMHAITSIKMSPEKIS